MQAANYYYFTLSATYQECEKLYRGPLRDVVLVADSGQRVQVPCASLRRFITSGGIRGRFRIGVTAANKMISFERMV